MGRESIRRLALITASIPVAAGIIRLSAAGHPAAIERPAFAPNSRAILGEGRP
jgi:hypothetical protein